MRLQDTFKLETLRAAALNMGIKPQQGGGLNNKDDQQDFDQQQQDPQQTDPSLKTAPYVRLLVRLGYEFQGHDEDMGGGRIGSSFKGQDGDMIIVKPNGGWSRFGPGSQRSQGPDVNSLGQSLVKSTMSQGDDQNTHSQLRQSGYQRIHKDKDGNHYYKHPQSGKTVTVQKDGRWGSSVGTGKGGLKLRQFLGDEQMAGQDPVMMKQQQQRMGPGAGAGVRQKPGTRGNTGTRTGGGGGGGRF